MALERRTERNFRIYNETEYVRLRQDPPVIAEKYSQAVLSKARIVRCGRREVVTRSIRLLYIFVEKAFFVHIDRFI